MATQVDNVQAVADLGGLVKTVYRGRVKKHYRVLSPVMSYMRQAGAKDYTMVGQKLVIAAQVRRPGGAMASTGWLPDHQYQAPINLETTPARRYRRGAVDNFVVARATGEGAFEDFSESVFDQMWESFEMMIARHCHGGSDATLCTTSSRTSQTVIVVKDGYGRVGTAPLLFIDEGDKLAWLDASAAHAVGGADTVSSIAYSTNTITFVGNFDDGVTVVAAGDPIVFCTTTDTAADYFETERDAAPLGLYGDLIDPAAANSSYLTGSESTYPRLKPLRVTSADWSPEEFVQVAARLQAKSQRPVGPDSHTTFCHPGAKHALAEQLLPYQQMSQLGKVLDGGYQSVRIAGHDFVEDGYNPHDIVYILEQDAIAWVDLDGEPAAYEGDGSQYSRLPNFDGQEWFIRDYLQHFMDVRNGSAAILAVTNDFADEMSPVPDA